MVRFFERTKHDGNGTKSPQENGIILLNYIWKLFHLLKYELETSTGKKDTV